MERFPEVGDRDLAEILENRDSKNTKNVMKTALNIVKAYCSEKFVDFHEMEHMTVADLITSQGLVTIHVNILSMYKVYVYTLIVYLRG